MYKKWVNYSYQQDKKANNKKGTTEIVPFYLSKIFLLKIN